MKNFIKNFCPAAIPALFLAFAVSCNSSNSYEPIPDDAFEAFATLVSTSEKATEVSVTKVDTDGNAYLTFPDQMVDTTKIAIGERFVIRYKTNSGQPFQSGIGTLYAYTTAYNSVLETAENPKLNMQQVVYDIWRTGNWINVISECAYSRELNRPTKYQLVVDENTLDNEYPEVYLVYEADTSLSAVTSTFYATFDISSVWERPNVKGIRIMYIDYQGIKTKNIIKTKPDNFEPVG